jgi:hypothetical protein
MTRNQGLFVVVGGIVAAIIFLLLTVYFGVAAAGHPHVKHMILFVLLAAVSLLVSWYAYPKHAA